MDGFYHDPLIRERMIRQYLAGKLSPADAEQFETHYLGCDDCFEEMRAAELLMWGLGQPAIESRTMGGVTVIRFTAASELTGTSSELSHLVRLVDARSDTKVLIDLERVSRIDSAGLGMLMRCFTHAVRNAGALKLLQPAPQVKRVLSMTRIDSVIPIFEDEHAALRSFESSES